MYLLSPSKTPALKSYFDAQMSTITDMSKRLFGSAQKLNELNIQVAQSLMEESLTVCHQLIEAEYTSEFMSIAASQVQPAAEKMRAYQQHLTNIAVGTNVELSKAAEEHISETTKSARAVADEVAKKASEETEKVTQRQKAAMEKMTNPLEGRDRGASRNSPVQ